MIDDFNRNFLAALSAKCEEDYQQAINAMVHEVYGEDMQNKTEGVGTQAHYSDMQIEPIDYIVQNKMDFLEGNVIKYVSRYKKKNGVEDLRKARQYLDWLIERELKPVVPEESSLNHE